MIRTQFLAGSYNVNRPDHFSSKPSKSPRTIKNTLHFKFGEDLDRLQETIKHQRNNIAGRLPENSRN